MTVAALRECMSQQEFMYWNRWHARRQQQRELAEKMARG